MRLLVTGGAGYVGSVVVESLRRAGHEITVLDDLSTGHRAAVSPEVRFVRGDLRDAAVLASALSAGTDAVLHFAARSIVADSMRDPLGYWEHNVGGALALLRAMTERGVRRFVFSSSAAVYGEPETQPISESSPARPSHAYGATKRAIELLLEDAARGPGVRSVFLRYFNAAGASRACGEDHRPETHLVPRLLRAALEPETSVAIYGDDWPTEDGTCVRDYVHVEDLAAAHLQALLGLESESLGAVNLGSGRGTSVREVIAAVERVTGRRLTVRVEPRRPGDPPRLVAAADRAAAVLGWRAERGIDAIVTHAWAWMQRHPHGYPEGALEHGADTGLTGT